MNAARKGGGPTKPRAKKPEPPSPLAPALAPGLCRRCAAPGQIGEDGFCPKCEKALEQACL